MNIKVVDNLIFTTKRAPSDLILVNYLRRYSESTEKGTKKKFVLGLKV